MPLKIYRRKGSAVYHYRGTLAGHRLRGSCGTANREAAQRIAAQVEDRFFKRGLDKEELTFPKAVAIYLASGKPDRFVSKLEDHWKDTKVKDMTAGAIRQSAIDIYPKATNATRNRQVIVPTQAIINHCAEMQLCDHLRMKRFKVDAEIKKPVTQVWIDDFRRKASRPDIAALALFMFATGARISEALAVQWEDVDLKARTVLIRQTKLGNERVAHLPTVVFLAIANLPRKAKPFNFAGKTSAQRSWEATIKRAGIEPLTFHSCRHGFATGLLRAGIDVVTVAKLGGWKSPAHVFSTYGHANEDVTQTDKLFDTRADTAVASGEQNQ